MVRKTSVVAFYGEQPLITSQQERLRNLFKRYPSIAWSDEKISRTLGWEQNVAWSRRSKLQREGFIVECGTVVNKQTGHEVTAYRLNVK